MARAQGCLTCPCHVQRMQGTRNTVRDRTESENYLPCQLCFVGLIEKIYEPTFPSARRIQNTCSQTLTVSEPAKEQTSDAKKVFTWAGLFPVARWRFAFFKSICSAGAILFRLYGA